MPDFIKSVKKHFIKNVDGMYHKEAYENFVNKHKTDLTLFAIAGALSLATIFNNVPKAQQLAHDTFDQIENLDDNVKEFTAQMLQAVHDRALTPY